MDMYQRVFKRFEKKYLLDEGQYRDLIGLIYDKLEYDKYEKYTVCNIYFDTPGFDIIRESLEKPMYKEKLRIRSYGVCDADGEVFVEMKKKFKGVVYKRRAAMSWRDGVRFLIEGQEPGEGLSAEAGQVLNEVKWFMHRRAVYPMLYLAYDRVVMRGKDDGNLRITFDTNIRWRAEEIDLTLGDYGHLSLGPGQYLMEIKTCGGMPIWLAEALSGLGIFPRSYSKYGTIYREHLMGMDGLPKRQPGCDVDAISGLPKRQPGCDVDAINQSEKESKEKKEEKDCA